MVCNFFTWVRNPNGFDRYVGRRVGGGRKFLVCNILIFSDFRLPDYQFARCFGYFDCVFSMISSNVGDSENPGPRSLLAQLLQRFIAAKHAGLVSRSLPLSWWTSCRTLVPKRFARGLMPP